MLYGTGNRGAIVTAIMSDSPGPGISPPPGGIVFSYLEISPARTGTITGAEITFTVPQSWLDQHNFTPQDIVMFHYTGGQWVALPTTVVKSGNGQVYFSATTPSFSRFAIAGRIVPAAAAAQRPGLSFSDLIGPAAPGGAASPGQGAGEPQVVVPQPAVLASASTLDISRLPARDCCADRCRVCRARWFRLVRAEMVYPEAEPDALRGI